MLEIGLRQAGVGRSHPLFGPVEGAPGYLRVRSDVVGRFTPRDDDVPELRIHPVPFREDKPEGTFRVFVQGGSTAAGYPYGYGASPAGMLRQRLQRTFPDRPVEVVTTAVAAINSYALLDFADEILEHSPDAVVIHAGHNEYLGLLGVGSSYSAGRRRPLVLAFLALRDLRLLQLARRAWPAPAPPAPGPGRRTLMARVVAEDRIPYGSDLYHRGLAQYRANLRALLAKYRAAGVPVLIGTPVSNERDQPPFLSGPGTGGGPTARELFDQGRALEAEGRHGEARAAYRAAKDRDELRFRAPEAIEEILRQVAADTGAHVVEVRQAFTAAAPHGLVGHDLMLEHLHPNLDGYFLLADAYYRAFREAGLIGPGDRAVPTGQARREMPVTAVDRIYGEHRIAHLMAGWPFSDGDGRYRPPPPETPEEVMARDFWRGSHSWPEALRRLLDHYRSRGDTAEAARVAVLLADAFPYRRDDQLAAADLLRSLGREDAAVYRRRAENG